VTPPHPVTPLTRLTQLTRLPRRVVIGLIIVVVVAVGALAVRGAIARLTAHDTKPDSVALRSRLNQLESDRFIEALTTAKHTTLSRQELLSCVTGDIEGNWNLSEVVSGGIDQVAIGELLSRSGDFGWQAAASGTYSKTIAPGVVVELVVMLGDDSLQFVANASSGLGCDQS
jgi:hypothetical protein